MLAASTEHVRLAAITEHRMKVGMGRKRRLGFYDGYNGKGWRLGMGLSKVSQSKSSERT